ncbi:MAG: pantetheine-phosphate adenylyltransferase [Verrucomicrobiota bacterium]
MRHAVYAGSFDPITNGHLWIVREAVRLFDQLTVAIGLNPEKQYTFSLEERLALLHEVLPDRENLDITHFDNRYLVDYAAEMGAQYIVRGIRSPLDYEYEHVMRQINEDIRPEVTTVFLMPTRSVAEVSSSMVKNLVGPSGWQSRVKRYVPEAVFHALCEKESS